MKTIIKISISLILLSFIFPFIPAQAAGNAIMRLTSTKTDYYVGDNVYVDINVETNGETLNTVRAIMDFTGSSVLQISDFAIGTAFPNLSPGKELNNSTQHINVGGFILVDSVSQNFLFGRLIFKANQIGTSTISFANGSHLISPDQEEKINLAGCMPITINVIGTPPPPPPENQPPVFQPVGNKQINLGDTLNFNVSATDPDGDLINLTWDLPSGANFSNVINNAVTVEGNFAWTPTAQGVYTITFTATDNNTDVKSSTLAVSIGVNVPPPPVNHPPIFEPVGEKVVNAKDSLTFNVTATDPDGDKVILTMEPLENAIFTPITSGVTSTFRFFWAPANFGVYYAVFKATDNNTNSLTSTLTVRITVFGGQCPPCGGGGGGSCPICECEKQKFGKDLEKAKPTIASPSHPSQDIWYADNSPKFVWEVSDMPIGYSFNLDQNPTADPLIGYYFSDDKAFNLGNISDGIWYFHLKAKYLDGWGPTVHYQVKIDTTPSEFFKPSIEEKKVNGATQYQVYFSALDKLSGVAYYEMKIDNGSWQKVLSPYTITVRDQEGKTFTLRAVDNAGNVIEAYIDLQKMIPLEKEPEKYNISKEKIILAAPVINRVIMPWKVGNIIMQNLIIVVGQSIPDSNIALYLSTLPQSNFNTKVDEFGNWQVYIDKELNLGKYSVWAIAYKDKISSSSSEKVYFTITEKYLPSKKAKPIVDWPLIMSIAVLVGALIYILRLINRKIFDKTKNFIKGKIWRKSKK